MWTTPTESPPMWGLPWRRDTEKWVTVNVKDVLAGEHAHARPAARLGGGASSRAAWRGCSRWRPRYQELAFFARTSA